MLSALSGYNFISGDISSVVLSGDIMPLRPEHALSSEPLHSRQVLRGEDICYLGEARFQREYGWLQGAKVLTTEFPWSYPKKHFTKKLSKQQLHNFIPSYSNSTNLPSLSKKFKNDAPPDLSSGQYFPTYYDTPYLVSADDLHLSNFYTDFTDKLEHLPILSAFEDIKLLSHPMETIYFPDSDFMSSWVANVPDTQIPPGFQWQMVSSAISPTRILEWRAVGNWEGDANPDNGCAMSYLSGLYWAADGRFGYVNIPNEWQYVEHDSNMGGAELWIEGIIRFNASYTPPMETGEPTVFCQSYTPVFMRITRGYVVLNQIYLDYAGNPLDFGQTLRNTCFTIGWNKAGRPRWAYRRTRYDGLEYGEGFNQHISLIVNHWYVVGTMGSHTKWWK